MIEAITRDMQSPHAHQMDVLEISVHYERSLKTVELHTCGETFRLVTQGLPKFPGNTIVERCAWLEQNADRYRRALMLEPRGHKDLYGGYLTEPVSAGADFGVIFLNNAGYSPHCGHGVIALATAAVELGWVERTSPETRIGIDAPCGFIEAFVEWDGKRAGTVRFVNVAVIRVQAGRNRRSHRLLAR